MRQSCYPPNDLGHRPVCNGIMFLNFHLTPSELELGFIYQIQYKNLNPVQKGLKRLKTGAEGRRYHSQSVWGGSARSLPINIEGRPRRVRHRERPAKYWRILQHFHLHNDRIVTSFESYLPQLAPLVVQYQLRADDRSPIDLIHL